VALISGETAHRAGNARLIAAAPALEQLARAVIQIQSGRDRT